MYLSITTIIARARIKQTIGSPTRPARIRGHTLPNGSPGCAAGIARRAPDELTSLSEKPEPPPADVSQLEARTRALSANGLAMRMKETAPRNATRSWSGSHNLHAFLCAPKPFGSPEV
jgi:hypothetical protein